jgi:hypothetical protein
MSTPGAPSLAHTLTANLQQIRSQIARRDAQARARRSGFLQRTPRKILLPDFLLALVALAADIRAVTRPGDLILRDLGYFL